MKYYISYKFLGADKDALRKTLEDISSFIEETGNSTYIFCRDIQQWGTIEIPVDQIIQQAFTDMDACDGIFVFVESEEKSEGMLLEVGYAKAKNKRIFLAIKKGINLRFVKSLADAMIEFDSLEDLARQLPSAL